MAGKQLAVVVIEVQAGALAVTPDLAVFTLSFLGPRTVAHQLEAVLPDLPEIVLIDIALIHVAAYRGAATDAAIATNTGHLDATTAVEEMVADLLLIFAKEALARVADVEDCLIT